MYLSCLNFKVLLMFLYLTIIVALSNSRQKKYPVSLAKLSTCREFDAESVSCEHFFPIEDFKNYNTERYKLFLKFYVMTMHDANIVLSGENASYTIVIGGASNTYSWIRDQNDTTMGLDSRVTHILSPLWPTTILVRQTYSGELEVAIPNVVDPLLKADASDLEVQSVCMYSWKTESRWFYNCGDDLPVASASNSTSSTQNDTSQIRNSKSCECSTV